MSKLKNLRVRMGLTQTEMAEIMGMDFQQVSKIELRYNCRAETKRMIKHLRLVELVWVHEKENGCSILEHVKD